MERLPEFSCAVKPWKNEFRVLFAPAGASAPALDEKVHYIFTGCYTATIDNRGQQQWTCVMGASDGAPPAERALLLSHQASARPVLLCGAASTAHTARTRTHPSCLTEQHRPR